MKSMLMFDCGNSTTPVFLVLLAPIVTLTKDIEDSVYICVLAVNTLIQRDWESEQAAAIPAKATARGKILWRALDATQESFFTNLNVCIEIQHESFLTINHG